MGGERHIKLGVVCLIAAFSILPMAGQILSPSDLPVAAAENRNLNVRPPLQKLLLKPREYTSAMSGYLNDNFAGRAIMVSAYNRFKNKLDRGNSEMVRGTSRNWMYYNFPRSWDQFIGRNPKSAEAIATGNQNLASFRDKANQQGAVFLAAYVPNKNRVYSEYVPPKYGELSKVSMTEAFNWDVSLLSVVTALKPDRPVYFQTDTHWTNYAAYHAYLAIMERYAAAGLVLPLLIESDLQDRNMMNFKGDLIALGGLNPEDYQEPHPDVIAPKTNPIKTQSRIPSPSGDPQFETIIHEVAHGNENTLVIIGDSFSKPLIEFFDHSFDRVVFIHNEVGAFNFDSAFKYNPDAILFLPAERFAEQIITYPKALY